MKELIRFSVSGGARHYHKSKRAIQKALKNEQLSGKKDSNGCGWFYKKDGDIYFYGLSFPENAKLQGLLSCFGVGRYLADKISDDGTMRLSHYSKMMPFVMFFLGYCSKFSQALSGKHIKEKQEFKKNFPKNQTNLNSGIVS